MRVWLKRSIIASLATCSYAISTPLLPATEKEAPIKAETGVFTAQTEGVTVDDSPQSNLEKTGRQYLFEGENPDWINSSLQDLEGFQVWLGGYVQGMSDSIDNYYGTDDSFELTKGNRLDIKTPIRLNDNGDIDMNVRVRAKLSLPKLRNRWHLMLKSGESADSGGTLSSESTRENRKTSLTVQALLTKAKGRELYFDVGVHTSGLLKLNPYIRLKKRYEIELDSRWNSRMTHSVFWKRIEGAGFDSAFVFDRPIDKRHLFRAQSDGTWWHDDGYYDFIQRLLLYKTVNVHRVFTYQGWTTFDNHFHDFKKTGYGLTFNWRERAYKNWLYFEVEPGVRWVEENQFSGPDFSVMVMLEMRFFKVL